MTIEEAAKSMDEKLRERFQTILQACADYHRFKNKQHTALADHYASGLMDSHEKLYRSRAEHHESWRAAIEAAIVELRGEPSGQNDGFGG